MAKFRKKTGVVEAFKWTGIGCEIPDWAKSRMKFRSTERYAKSEYLIIPTLEGDMRANVGDFIIKGVKDEIYPCKSDIFEATYEPVEN